MKKIFFDWWGGGGDTFASRVESDGGTFESLSCFDSIKTELGTFYNDASWVLTPNGYKKSKLYAAKPTDGSGDLTFTRDSGSTRKNSTSFERITIDTPRLDSLGASCPSILLEKSRTNLITFSAQFKEWTQLFTTTTEGNSIPDLDGADNIWIEGNYAYITAHNSDCLNIFDISSPASPVFVSKIYHGGSVLLNGAIGIKVVGDYAYVTSTVSNALEIIDISNKSVPAHAGSLVLGSSCWNVDVVGDYAYVVRTGALSIVDITTKTAPTLAGTLTDGTDGAELNTPLAVKVSGNNAFIVDFASHAFEVVDITTKTAPAHAGKLLHGGSVLLQGAHGLWVDGNYAYVASRTSNALEIIDITTPSSPTHHASLADGAGGAELTGAVDIYKVGNNLYIACYEGGALEVVDVSNPATPSHVGKIIDGDGGAALTRADMVFIKDNHAYITAFVANALEVVDISTPSTPSHAAKVVDLLGDGQTRETTANNVHLIRKTFTKAASSLSYVCAILVKPNGRDWICLQGDDGTNVAGRFFNIANGTLGNTRIVGSGFSLTNSAIVNCGDDGYLCLIEVVSTTSTTFQATLLLSTDGTTISYVGNTSNGVNVKFSHVIQASSVIKESIFKTTDVTGTRSADAITALTSVSGLIGQTEGTLYIKFKAWADSTAKAFSISDGTTNNKIGITLDASNNIVCSVVSGGVSQASISTAFSSDTEYKVAITYQNDKAALFVNGTKIGEDLTVTVPACSQIRFDDGAGASPLYANVLAVAISKTALSDAAAQTLTT